MTLSIYRPSHRIGVRALAASLLLVFGATFSIAATRSTPPAVAEDAQPTPEPDLLAGLPPYLPKAPVKGELVLAGSTAMNQLAHLWADGIKHVHSEAKVTVNMYESGQVLDRLAKGEMQIGLVSRPLTEREIKQGGVASLASAKDVLGIVVNPNNPLEQLSLEQGIQLLRDPNATSEAGASNWGQLGLTGEWTKTPITLYGRSEGAGAWGYLVNRFLGDGAPSRKATDCNSYAEICQKVAKDRGGVGYVSLSLAPPQAGKVLPLLLDTGEVVPPPKAGEPVDPRYPLVRELYVVLKWKEGDKLSPVAEEFLRYVLSRSGQQDAVKAGLLPLRRDEVLASRDQLGWTGLR